ncbi:MAG: NUDIX domain-containing protein [Acidimicrobiia bacterium]|nr:NUDIX domain-containing protein [Acidimicrobiia bacterium]
MPAATVVPLRDGDDGLETLLLLRASGLSFAGGMWVWPGGRIDDADRAGAAAEGHEDEAAEEEAAARQAAVREAAEEAGLRLDPTDLVWFAHWTPPAENPKRFRTHFFAVHLDTVDAAADVHVDGGEILEAVWIDPVTALARRDAGTLGLTPPTAITLAQLSEHRTAADAMASWTEGPVEFYVTRFAKVDGGGVALYHGDAAYEGGDPNAPGARHRLWMLDDRWWYERTV